MTDTPDNPDTATRAYQRPARERLPRVEDSRGWDVEVVALCDAMNEVPGIHTHESCSGHGVEDFRVWFRADDLDALPRLLYWFDGCHSGFYEWRVEVGTDCGMSPATFCVRRAASDTTFAEADRIAVLIREQGEDAYRACVADQERERVDLIELRERLERAAELAAAGKSPPLIDSDDVMAVIEAARAAYEYVHLRSEGRDGRVRMAALVNAVSTLKIGEEEVVT